MFVNAPSEAEIYAMDGLELTRLAWQLGLAPRHAVVIMWRRLLGGERESPMGTSRHTHPGRRPLPEPAVAALEHARRRTRRLWFLPSDPPQHARQGHHLVVPGAAA